MKRKLILTSAYVLSGLRYNAISINVAFEKVNAMKESSTYQAILREGRTEGLQAMRDTILDILRNRFGEPPIKMIEAVAFVTDFGELRSAIRSAATIARLDEFHLA